MTHIIERPRYIVETRSEGWKDIFCLAILQKSPERLSNNTARRRRGCLLSGKEEQVTSRDSDLSLFMKQLRKFSAMFNALMVQDTSRSDKQHSQYQLFNLEPLAFVTI
jgi:hypothetical protein